MSEQYLINGQTLTDIADAIRDKSGETGSIKASQFASKIESLSIGGGISPEEYSIQYVQGDITTDSFLDPISNDLTYIYGSCFMHSLDLDEVNLPKVIEIGEYAFSCCTNLSDVYLPECKYIRQESFGLLYCHDYEMGASYTPFTRDNNLRLHFPKIQEIDSLALNDVYIDPADLSNAILLGKAFGLKNDSLNTTLHCENLTTLEGGWVKALGIEKAILPKCSSFREHNSYYNSLESALSYSDSLLQITISPTELHNYDFAGDRNLYELILTCPPPYIPEYDEYQYTETMFSEVFSGTPINDLLGVIRVPDEYYEEYLQEPFWQGARLIPVSYAGILPWINKTINMAVGKTKTFTIGYLYGWDFNSIYLDYFEGAGNLSVEDMYIDLEKQQLVVTITAVSTCNQDTIPYYLEDDQGHYSEGYLYFSVREPSETLYIDIETQGSFGFDFYNGDELTVQSNNQNQSNTTAESKIVIQVPYDGTLYLNWYIESESCCDKGSISSINSTTYPTNQVYGGNSSTTPNTGTLALPVSAGENFIYLKYRKDGSVDHGIDAFRVTFRLE